MSDNIARVARQNLLAACLVTAPTVALAAAGPSDTLQAFLDAMTRGDMAAVQATNADDESITDEIPPYQWHGPGAFQTWLAAVGQDAKTNGETEEKARFGPTLRLTVTGDHAYAVVKALYTYRQNGQRMAEPARIAFALAAQGDTWKIVGWTWAGDAPRPAKAR